MEPLELASQVLDPSSEVGKQWTLDWSSLPAGQAEELLKNQPDRIFQTSGTSGQPKLWHRTGTQLALELEVTAGLLGGEHDGVYATVDRRTLYGYVGACLGAQLNIPTTFDELGNGGTPIPGKHPVIFTVAATWRRLRRILRNAVDSSSFERVSIVHAGSCLASNVPETLMSFRLGDCARILDFFGTTETGIIGSREALPDARPHWTIAADTRLTFGRLDENGEARPAVTSPRLGRLEGERQSQEVILGDWLTPVDNRTFRFNGRRESFIKPGGRAVNLDRLESQISQILPDFDIACMPMAHPEYGEHVELLIVASRQNATQAMAMLRRQARSLDLIPDSVRSVRHIPRSAMGKVRRVPLNIHKEVAA